MADEERRDEEEEGRPRPRVVDKRISARVGESEAEGLGRSESPGTASSGVPAPPFPPDALTDSGASPGPPPGSGVSADTATSSPGASTGGAPSSPGAGPSSPGVSSGAAGTVATGVSDTASTTETTTAPPASGTDEVGVPGSTAPGVAGERLWTPEQEAQAREVAQQIVQTPSVQWVVEAAANLANVAGIKIDLGAPEDAQLAIDALAALLNGVGHRLQGAEQPLRQVLAQLQLAFAEQVAPPPPPPPPQ